MTGKVVMETSSNLFSADLFLLSPRNWTVVHKGLSYPVRQNIVLLVGLVLAIVIGLVILMNPVTALYQDERLRQNGVPLEGVIVKRRSSTAKTTSYYITYGYSAANQQFYTREVIVSENTYTAYPEGMPVSVVYLPSDPNVSILVGKDADHSERDKFLLFGLGWLVIVFTAILAAILKLREQRRWVQKSHIIPGNVCESQGHAAGDKYRYFKLTVRYRFVSPSGVELFGRQSEARDDLAYQVLPKPKTPVAILYLDDKHYKML